MYEMYVGHDDMQIVMNLLNHVTYAANTKKQTIKKPTQTKRLQRCLYRKTGVINIGKCFQAEIPVCDPSQAIFERGDIKIKM